MELYLPPQNAKLTKESEFFVAKLDDKALYARQNNFRMANKKRWEDPKQHEVPQPTAKPVNVYDAKTGKYIATYPSAQRAAVALGFAKDLKEAKKSAANHIRAISRKQGKMRTYKGYIFKFDNGNHGNTRPYTYSHKVISKAVIGTSPEGVTKTFCSLQSAQKYTGIRYSLISDIAKGLKDQYDGWTFKFKKENDIHKGENSEEAKERRGLANRKQCRTLVMGIEVARYNGLKECAKGIGVSYQVVWRAMKLDRYVKGNIKIELLTK